MNETEVRELARAIAEELKSQDKGPCDLTEAEQRAVRELLQTKKKTVKIFVYLVGALVLWALKDIYTYVMDHLKFIK